MTALRRPTRGLASCALAIVVSLTSGPANIVAGFNRAQDGLKEVRELLDRGAYMDAEREAIRLVASFGIQDGGTTNDQTEALTLLVEAKVRNGSGGETATLDLATRVIRLKEGSVGPEHPDLVTSLHNLGTVHVERGELKSAAEVHQRGLLIRERKLGRTDPLTATSLEHLALAQILLERFGEARNTLQRALAIREPAADRAPLALARTLELQALLNRYSGDYDAAMSQAVRVDQLRAVQSTDHPDRISLLDLQGDLHYLRGDIAGAQRMWSEGLALGERSLGGQHPALALFLRKLALAADAIGNRAESRSLLARGIAIGNRRLAPCNVESAGLVHDAAVSQERDGNFDEAKRLYQQEWSTLTKCHANANWRATALHNTAGVSAQMGDFAEAERLHRLAITLWSTSLGSNHPYVARGLDALAEVLAARGQPEQAGLLYRQALSIRRSRLGPDHPDVAWTLTNLARMAADSGNLTVADRYVAQAIDIFTRSGASDEPDHLARVLALKGELARRRGRYGSAKTSFSEALAARERIFGAAHPLTAEARADMAFADLALGSYDAALVGALTAENTGRSHLQFTVRYLPERQAMAYAAKRPRALDLALTVAASGSTSAQTSIFNAVIQSRGVILDELAARARAAGTLNSQVAALNTDAVQKRQRFANLVVRSLQESVPRAMLDEARQQKEDAERALAESSADARAEIKRAQISFKDVDSALPRDSVLVSFVVYGRTRATSETHRLTSVTPVRLYGAFVHRGGSSEVAFMPLGVAAWIDGLIKAWRIEAGGGSIVSGRSASQASIAYRTAGAALRRAVWDPLNAHVAGAARTFIVPDGLLNIVNVAALPDRNGRYLVEGSSIIHYLSTERDLIIAADQPPGRGLFAVGGPTFGQGATKRAAITPALRSGCDGFGEIHFEDLPGSRREVIEIGKFWPAQGAGDAQILTSGAATETAVKQSLGGRRIVHLATHGFFLGSDCSLGVAGTRSVGGLAKKAPAKKASTVAENPLSLAGLAFAGANRRRSVRGDQDDGILTAEEIGGLNLQGTEWAVLSACDTGLGEIKAGEGVFGLRRAFQVAGARTVIMSLWSVEDRSAMQWMRALYEGRLRRGLDTADAVRAASLAVLAERRARGQSTHPFYWAGFVAAGDWR